MMEEDLDESDLPLLRDILALLGLGDVPAFSLTWEDCRNYLHSLGYRVSPLFHGKCGRRPPSCHCPRHDIIGAQPTQKLGKGDFGA